MKYFIAIVLPDNIKNEIIKFQNNYFKDKVVPLIEPHITIKAHGGLTEDLKWLEETKKIIKDFEPFKLALTEVGMFGDSIVFMLPQPTDNLFKLHKKLLSAVNVVDYDLGKFFEGDNYNPHLTLAIEKWGVSTKALQVIKKEATQKLLNLSEFEVSLVRIHRQEKEGEAYEVFLDIPLLSKADGNL